MVVAAPKCRLCQHPHWTTEPHVFDRAPKQSPIKTFRPRRSNALEEGEAPQPGMQLVLFDRARVAIEQAKSVDEVKLVRDQAQAIRLYFKQQRQSLEMQNNVAEIKLRAERRMGEMLPSQIESQSTTLSEIGISKYQSGRWQTEASVSEYDFERFLMETKAEGGELTSAGLYRLGRASSGSDDGHEGESGGVSSSALSSGPPDAPVSVRPAEVDAPVEVEQSTGLGCVSTNSDRPSPARQPSPELVCPQCAFSGPRSAFKAVKV